MGQYHIMHIGGVTESNKLEHLNFINKSFNRNQSHILPDWMSCLFCQFLCHFKSFFIDWHNLIEKHLPDFKLYLIYLFNKFTVKFLFNFFVVNSEYYWMFRDYSYFPLSTSTIKPTSTNNFLVLIPKLLIFLDFEFEHRIKDALETK